MLSNAAQEEEEEFAFSLFAEIPFKTRYRCYSAAMLPGHERNDIESGGKIILPPSALNHLTRLSIMFPILFKLTNKRVQPQQVTHCGVLEFVAEEGKAYLPYWMMQMLLLDEGTWLNIEYAALPLASYSKFQPQSVDFLDITNPKAVLENSLRNFACLTTGDVISISYNDRVYGLRVLETKPSNAVRIIECDMNVDFAPPIGYVERPKEKPEEKEPMIDPAQLMDEDDMSFFAFKGKGNRLDGKKRDSEENTPPSKRPYQRGIPDYSFSVGQLNFIRNILPSPQNNKENEPGEEFKAFSGEGHSLRKKKD